MNTEARYELSDSEIIDRGMRALEKALGHIGLMRFMSQIEYAKDYLKVQERLYENMSIDEIYEAAKDSLSK